MASTQHDIIFINATVLDGSADMQPRPGCIVAVHDGKIAQVADAPAGADPASHARHLAPDARIIDLAGAYLMPGLINLHAHFIGSGKPVSSGNASGLIKLAQSNPIGRALIHKLIKTAVLTQLASGVTTVRGAGDPALGDIWCRDQIRAKAFAGPRVIAPGTGITVPDGHGAGLFAQVSETPEQAAEAVRDLAAHGADVIKLFITGGVFDATKVGEPGVLRMPAAMIEAACAESHKLGLPVMAHVESTEGVLAALEGGVDTIEHGAPMTPRIEELYLNGSGKQLAGRKPTVTCTISPALPFVKLPAEKTHSTEVQKVNGDIVCAGIVESARRALELGIPVGLGTDSSCPYVTHYDMWREVAYFAKYAGVSNAFALHTATQVNAEILGLADVCGQIREGLSADILVTRGNPLEDLRALSTPAYVMAAGALLENPQVKRMPELDAELDEILADATPLPTTAELTPHA